MTLSPSDIRQKYNTDSARQKTTDIDMTDCDVAVLTKQNLAWSIM